MFYILLGISNSNYTGWPIAIQVCRGINAADQSSKQKVGARNSSSLKLEIETLGAGLFKSELAKILGKFRNIKWINKTINADI